MTGSHRVTLKTDWKTFAEYRFTDERVSALEGEIERERERERERGRESESSVEQHHDFMLILFSGGQDGKHFFLSVGVQLPASVCLYIFNQKDYS